jgi:ABC-type glycerol-3-phosphate transport system substrate-binding protein
MRNRVFWNSPHTRLFSCLTLLGLMALALAGCGGGGSSSPPVNTPTISLTGTVKDTGSPSAPVVNALVSIVGTSQTTHTDSGGHFSFVSVPATSKAFTVGNPNAGTYFSYANYGGKLYDLILCTMPLPTLHTGTNAIGEVDILLGGNNPPPPPLTNGCP